MNLDDLKPILNKNGVKKIMKNSENWKDFLKCTKNPFMKDVKLFEQQNICPVCNKQFYSDQKKVLYHNDYFNECEYPEENRTIKIFSPTNAKPKRNITVPNCQNCLTLNYKSFTSCAKRVSLVHYSCHLMILGVDKISSLAKDKNLLCISQKTHGL